MHTQFLLGILLEDSTIENVVIYGNYIISSVLREHLKFFLICVYTSFYLEIINNRCTTVV
jgi:hypothetical protein